MKNKLGIIIMVILGLLLLVGCNNSNVSDLEDQNEELESELEDKEDELDEKMDMIEGLSNSIAELEAIIALKEEPTEPTEPEEEIVVENDEVKTYYGAYQYSDDFSDLINDNPIDRDYKVEMDAFQNSSDFSTYGWVELEVKYTGFWETEMNNVYNHLLDILESTDQENLIAAQASWLDYIAKENTFVVDKYIATGYLGSLGTTSIQTVNREKVRQRTIDLMEYSYILEDTVTFIYGNE